MTKYKRCSRCRKYRKRTQFNKSSNRSDGLHPYCRNCRSKQRGDKSYRERNRIKCKQWHRDNKYRATSKMREWLYGINEEQYQYLLKSQHGLCRICLREMNPPCVDHDHKSGKVRGLLCRSCNSGLGQFYDNKRLLKRALSYLKGG